jgi:hypothetical protein
MGTNGFTHWTTIPLEPTDLSVGAVIIVGRSNKKKEGVSTIETPSFIALLKRKLTSLYWKGQLLV